MSILLGFLTKLLCNHQISTTDELLKSSARIYGSLFFKEQLSDYYYQLSSIESKFILSENLIIEIVKPGDVAVFVLQ